MTSVAAGEPAARKKHVRFARMEEEEEEEEEEQEEDTLFDQRKDVKRGLRSALKGGGRGGDAVEVRRAGRGGPGACGRWLVSLTLCASFLGLGMCISVLGPTLGDLASNVNKNISNISYIFAGRATGYIGGSLLGGILFDLVNPHLLLGLAMLGTALGMFATPFCKRALLLTLLVSSVGVSMGILDTGGNVLILDTWGDHAGPHLQALHFSFAVGAFFSPIIAKLVFGSESTPDPSASVAGPSLGDHNESRPSIAMHQYYFHSKTGVLMSMWAYMVIGSFIVLVSLFFFILYSRSSAPAKQAATSSGKQLFSKHHVVLVTLLSIFFFWYVGAEVAFGSFIFTYAKDFMGLERAQAAGLNSLFWGSFAACRGLAIFFTACVNPGTLILASLVGSTVSSLLLVLFSNSQVAVWSCTALYGASMAATFPSGISWLEQYTTVTGRSAAVFVVGAALGEMVLPAVLGFLLGRVHDHPVLMYLCLGTATITSILFPVMYKLASPGGGATVRKSRARGSREADDGEYRQALLDSVDHEEAEPEEGGESEADQCNDGDFEVIEMDDTSLVNSPNKVSSSPPNAS
ncbi:sodium-dependent glucose transporter 1 [Brachyhypopomus gauderio]|uniref:sodium-dependent glucose transporter 1 n=1 Tax=Brachyhypopomus gauderio TaxID=698409 RepID=UPI004041E321